MNEIKIDLGVAFGETFKLPAAGGGYSRYFINTAFDLISVTTNQPAKDYRITDLLRNPEMIVKIPHITEADFYALKYYKANGYKYITVDKSGEIWVWQAKPEIDGVKWISVCGGGLKDQIILKSSKIASWSDTKPTDIQSILEEVEFCDNI